MEIKKLVDRAYTLDNHLPFIIVIGSSLVFFYIGMKIATIMGPRRAYAGV
jgi:NADH:ubiquinone oxidoreductase subunit 3 (subunit A)